MRMKSLLYLLNAKLKKKNVPVKENGETFDFKFPVDFNQGFFLYILYQWMQEKSLAFKEKKEINPLIAINYYRLKKKFRFPDNSFDDFENRDEQPFSDYTDKLFKKKEEEYLITDLSSSFTLTEAGKIIVEIIKRGNYYEYDFFDKSIKVFNQELIDSIDANIEKLKNLSDNSLISISLHLINIKSATI